MSSKGLAIQGMQSATPLFLMLSGGLPFGQLYKNTKHRNTKEQNYINRYLEGTLKLRQASVTLPGSRIPSSVSLLLIF